MNPFRHTPEGVFYFWSKIWEKMMQHGGIQRLSKKGRISGPGGKLLENRAIPGM
jgi:hypothetical protein